MFLKLGFYVILEGCEGFIQIRVSGTGSSLRGCGVTPEGRPKCMTTPPQVSHRVSRGRLSLGGSRVSPEGKSPPWKPAGCGFGEGKKKKACRVLFPPAWTRFHWVPFH